MAVNIVLIVFLIYFCLLFGDYRVYVFKNSNYMMIGKVEKDGTVKNQNYMFMGKVKSDGQ